MCTRRFHLDKGQKKDKTEKACSCHHISLLESRMKIGGVVLSAMP